ncbi:MAG: MFS transporter [Alphaproteobacteria bacterium]|nr:MFS transporter [Alphaproteobacteria bacterium]
MAGSGRDSRVAALSLLDRVLRERVPLADAWEQALAGEGRGVLRRLATFDPRDRGFVRMLVTTALRRLGRIDAIIDSFCAQPPDAILRQLLRLGTAQLVFLRTPPHAAVATTMALTDRLAPPHRAFLNAVLRRIAAAAPTLADEDAAEGFLPDWLRQPWRAHYGEDAARAIERASLIEPPLDLTLKDRSAESSTQWAARLAARVLPNGSLRCTTSGPIESLPGFAEGAWWVQDAAAALPARLLESGLTRQGTGIADATVLDLCAAPGGKTAQFAAAGGQVTAVDRAPRRLDRLAANLRRLHLAAELVGADMLGWPDSRLFAAVLLDAPCSATGTLRRHPDVAYLKTGADVASLASAQRQMIAAAARRVRPGGVLVYAVCSLQPEEGEAIVATLGDTHPGLVPFPIEADEVAGEATWITPAGEVRTLPCHWAEHGGLDGFFISRFRRL